MSYLSLSIDKRGWRRPSGSAAPNRNSWDVGQTGISEPSAFFRLSCKPAMSNVGSVLAGRLALSIFAARTATKGFI